MRYSGNMNTQANVFSVFRAYDIRGLVSKDFDEAWVERLGKACGTLFLREGKTRAVLARDCRPSSPGYYDAVSRGLRSTGVDVILLGMVPSPCMYYAVRHLNLGAGIMVTASHNPSQYNGFKVQLGDTTLYGEGIQELRRLMEKGEFPEGEGLASEFDIRPAYVDEVITRIGSCRPFKVVLDGGNGAGGPVCLEVLRRLGAEVIPLFCEPDGTFPNHHPDPVKEENMLALREKVLAEGADLGVGLDGDGDRLGLMDRTGRLLFGDELLAIYARDLLQRHPGAIVLGDVKCSQRLFDDVKARGGRPEMCRTGHSVVKALLRELGGLAAGELSGHMFHAENWYGFDDAIYSAARALKVLTRLGAPLEELPGWPPAWNTPEINLPCADDRKFEVVRRLQAWYRPLYPMSDIDGARVLFPHGWGLVRASNTSPTLVMRFEADSPEQLAAIQKEMKGKTEEIVAEIAG